MSNPWRELDAREADGISVILEWHCLDDILSVTVADKRTGEAFTVFPPADEMLTAFHHPFAYAASHEAEMLTLAEATA